MVEVYLISHQWGFSTNIILAVVQLSFHRLSCSSLKDTDGMGEVGTDSQRVNKLFNLNYLLSGENYYEL